MSESVMAARPPAPAVDARDNGGTPIDRAAVEKAKDLLEQAQGAVAEADAEARAYIAREPIKAAAVSAAAGAVLAMSVLALVRRMLRK